MNTPLLPHATDEVLQTVLVLHNMIEEQVPPESLVEVGGHLADLLAKYSVRETNPAAYAELRALVVGTFRMAAARLRDQDRAPDDILEDIDASLNKASLILTLAAAAPHRGEAA